MSYQFKFEKILTIREREKEEASSDYNQSVNRFEEAAEKLEVKKFVKIKEKDHSNYLAIERAEEAKQMDDISLQQYMQHEKVGG